ncbi:MAG: DUF4214 domain-containing protein [Acidimicrobiales bacterium]
MTIDLPTPVLRNALGSPLDISGTGLARRRFLQAMAVTAGATALPTWMSDMAAAATPVSPTDGILVLVTFNGGLDGVTLCAPIHDGAYHDRRSGLALTAGTSIPLTDDRGLHPALGEVKAHWDQGNVAIIEGVGNTTSGSLSHFEHMARIMTAKSNDGAMTSGWLGRYTDGLAGGADPFHAVSFGHNVPLVVQGNTRRATGISIHYSGMDDIGSVDPWERLQLQTMANFGSMTTGRGDLADTLGDAAADAVAIGSQLAPLYAATLPEDEFVAEMTMAARLINANLGIRVLHLEMGDFDGHANHAQLHADGLAQFNAGLAAFFTALDRRYADQVTVLTATEFGRRMRANRSGGTDHGAATTFLAIGSQVVGGLHGQMPSLSNLDNNGNLRPTVDYREVYSTVLDTWLDADPGQVLGAGYGNMGFLAAPASEALPPPISVATGLNLRNEVMRLYLAYFLREPDTVGLHHWVANRRAGMPLATISEAFAQSGEFQQRYGSLSDAAFVERVYQNVMGRSPDASGRDFWIGQLRSGVTRGSMMVGFSESDEYRASAQLEIDAYDTTGPVARLYRAYFRRSPDTDGLQFWSSTGYSLERISQEFATSTEFQQTYGSLSDAAFVERVYENVMGRSPDAEGRSFWTGQLGNGVSRGSMMVGFSESQEFVAQVRAG